MIEQESRNIAQPAPPISALFLVVFDQKIGYSIAYKRAIDDVQLEGVVEYKSLPSGLHNVRSDLVYFVHEQHAGISAFVSSPAGEAERNAQFAAVGVLVPLSYGKLGRCWLHAAALRELAQATVSDIGDTVALDRYWESHRIDRSEEQGQDPLVETDASKQSTGSSRKTRAPSDAAALGRSGHTLSIDHPAMSLPQQLETLGPLLFPLYRAALLRKRILVLTQAPVQQACDLVYNLSVISNIPPHLADAIPGLDASSLRPLFNVGVHDIAYLAGLSKENRENENGNGSRETYIACSTDEILATKQNIYDILVEFPRGVDTKNGAQQWPVLRKSSGEQLKATQRDLRRYRALKKELQKFEKSRQQPYHDDEESDTESENDESETAPLTHTVRPHRAVEDTDAPLDGETSLVEATTWTAMAYTGFLWWASAGERESWLEDEAIQDTSLLMDLPIPESARSTHMSSTRSGNGKKASDGMGVSSKEEEESIETQAKAMLIIAFAHRLTTMALESMEDMVQPTDAADEADEVGYAVSIDSDDLRRMGLDVWSEGDREFARELLHVYFQREAEVRGQGLECCGLKIC